MRILYLGPFELPDRNAAAHRVISIAKSLRASGHEVELIGVTKNRDEAGKHFFFDGFRYSSVPYPNGVRPWIKQIVEFVPLSIIEEKKPDIVILYNFYAIAQYNIIKFCHSHNIKVLGDITEWYRANGLSLRETIKRIDIPLRMKVFNYRLDGIIAISRYLYDYYKKKVPTVYIPPTVDYSSPMFERERKLSSHSPVRLIYTGNISSDKDSLSDIVRLVDGNHHFKLDIIGVDKNRFQAVNNFIPDSENIVFHGSVSHSKALQYLKNADFQLIIRKENIVTRAGFPTKFVESLACGIPVIATPSSNICDYLINGKNGFIIDENLNLKECLKLIEKLSTNDIVSMKNHALSTKDFSYLNYTGLLKFFLVHDKN